jgi:hypothetical protein
MSWMLHPLGVPSVPRRCRLAVFASVRLEISPQMAAGWRD